MGRADLEVGDDFVDAGTDVLSVVKLFQAQRISNVLVRDTQAAPPRVGIFTATTLQRAILDGRPLNQLAVGELANYALIEVQPSDQLGDVMAVMLRHRVRRVVVVDGTHIVGVLEALDLFSFLSNQSHLITVQIEEAKDLAGLSQAAARITRMIALLHRSGSRINLIAKLVQQLNARLFERAVMHARNEGVNMVFIHALSENTAMLNIARKAGALVERDGSESEAYLKLPEATMDSRMTEMVETQVAEVDFQLKLQAKRFWEFLADVQSIREGVRAGRHKSAE